MLFNPTQEPVENTMPQQNKVTQTPFGNPTVGTATQTTIVRSCIAKGFWTTTSFKREEKNPGIQAASLIMRTTITPS